MSTIAIISIVLGVVMSLGGVLFNFLKLGKISKENEYKNIINLQRKDIVDFKGEISKLQIKIESLNQVVGELDSALLICNTISLSFPFPFWYKSSDGKMRMLNDSYCKTYQRCRKDYIGKTDHEVWDKEMADKFVKTDNEVLNSKLGYIVDYDNEVANMLVIKWRIHGLTKNEFYIAGVSVPHTCIKQK